jgi:sugar phosphate isomerase/epimerase
MSEDCRSRRRFLQTAAAGMGVWAGAARLPWSASGEDSPRPPRVEYCFSLYGMRSLKLHEALQACADVGYDGVELDASAGQAGDPGKLSAGDRRDVRTQLRDLGLSLPGLMENLTLLADDAQHRRNLDRLKSVGELGHELSPDAPPVVETILGGRPERWDEDKQKMAAALEDWARAAEAAKTVVAIKAHVGGALHTPEGAKWLLERVESRWIRLNYDYSHFQLRGFELVKSLELLLDRTAFIHVKDNKGRLGDFQFLLPGEGDIHYAAYFAFLKKGGYRGAVCVEVSGQIFGKPGYDPLVAAKTSYANLSPILEKAGLRG